MNMLDMQLALEVREEEIVKLVDKRQKHSLVDRGNVTSKVSNRWGWLNSLIAAF